MEMNFSLPESHGERHVENKFDDIMASQEEAIMVHFTLPDASIASYEFQKGQTVAVLKSYLVEELELQDIQLYFQDRVMLDPFSLLDFPNVERAKSLDIEVRIENTSQSRK